MSVCNLHANCNLIVKSTISRQAKGYSTYMRYRRQGMLRIYLKFVQFAQFAMSNYKMYNLSNCNVSFQFAWKLQFIVKSTISRQAKGYSTYMRYRGQDMLRIYLQFAQFAQFAMSNHKMYNLSNCNVRICNLDANCNLIVKSTISRQAKGYSTYMRYRGYEIQGTGYAYNLFVICAICAILIVNVKLQNVQFVKLQCQFAICMEIATSQLNPQYQDRLRAIAPI